MLIQVGYCLITKKLLILLTKTLSPDTGYAEEQDYDVDFLSNGFKHRSSSSWTNGNGATYLCIAFAETPFKYSNAR
jgi:hypothetical protein